MTAQFLILSGFHILSLVNSPILCLPRMRSVSYPYAYAKLLFKIVQAHHYRRHREYYSSLTRGIEYVIRANGGRIPEEYLWSGVMRMIKKSFGLPINIDVGMAFTFPSLLINSQRELNKTLPRLILQLST